MHYYVSVPQLRGRLDYLKLAKWTSERGIKDAEYYAGGWSDNVVYSVKPHVKFVNEADAIAYALTIGARVSTTVPIEG